MPASSPSSGRSCAVSKVRRRASETSHRDIEVPVGLVKVLREHKMASPFKADGELCFPTKNGRADNLQNVMKRGLAVALKRAGIKRATSLHDLRHVTRPRCSPPGCRSPGSARF